MKTMALLFVLLVLSGCDEDAINSLNHEPEQEPVKTNNAISASSAVDTVKWYSGLVNSDGTGVLPENWESHYNGVGVYNITHGFNMPNPDGLVVVATPADTQGLSAVVTTNGEDTITIIITDHQGNNVNARFRFIAIRNFIN